MPHCGNGADTAMTTVVFATILREVQGNYDIVTLAIRRGRLSGTFCRVFKTMPAEE
jgi:hypothetical protein